MSDSDRIQVLLDETEQETLSSFIHITPPYETAFAATADYASSAVVFGAVPWTEVQRRVLDDYQFRQFLQQHEQAVRTEGREQIENLVESSEFLAQAVLNISTSVHRLEERTSRFSVPLNAISKSGLELKASPVWVSVQQDDEDHFVAELVEVGVVAYGETVSDAVASAADSLCEVFEELNASSSEELGPRPAKWKVAVNQLIKKTD